MIIILLSATSLSAGILIGWWLRAAERGELRDPNLHPEINAESERVMSRLRNLLSRITRQVGEHQDRVTEIHDELTAGDRDDHDLVVHVVSELIDTNERMKKQLAQARDRLTQQQKQLETHAVAAFTDALTGLANRRAFDDALNQCCDSYLNEGQPATVMLLDVDHFKKFNDTHGHHAGDEVLRSVANILSDHVPSSHLVARHGGEEFAVLFRNKTCVEIRAVAETVRSAIERACVSYEGLQLKVTVSIGLADWSDRETGYDLVQRSDEALYASKSAGRNCIHYHDGFQCLAWKSLPRTPSVVAENAGERTEAAVEAEKEIQERKTFRCHVARRIQAWKQGGAPVSVLLVRIDHVQRLKDDYAPETLGLVFRSMDLCVRAMLREMDHAARFDDHTIVVMLPGTHLVDAATIAQRMRQQVSRTALPPPAEIEHFTVSVGMAEANADDKPEELVQRARGALQSAAPNALNCTYAHNGQSCELVGAGEVLLTT